MLEEFLEYDFKEEFVLNHLLGDELLLDEHLLGEE
jgi:hypothetical protein